MIRRESKSRAAVAAHTLLLNAFRNFKGQFFLPRFCDHLHSDRQPFGRLCYRYADSRHAQQIEPLAITPGIEVLDVFAVDFPSAFTMMKRRNRRHRAEQDRKLSHLLKNLHANQVAFDPAIVQTLARVRRFRSRPTVELLQNWTQFRFAAARERPEQHSTGDAKKFPPELACLLQTFRSKRLDFKTGGAQCVSRLLHCSAGFTRHWCSAIIFEISDT